MHFPSCPGGRRCGSIRWWPISLIYYRALRQPHWAPAQSTLHPPATYQAPLLTQASSFLLQPVLS